MIRPPLENVGGFSRMVVAATQENSPEHEPF